MSKIRNFALKACVIIFVMQLLFPAPPCQAKAAGPSSLAATGLLQHPDERAEDILLRANMYDVKAILLASLGYSLGLDGFAKDPWVAVAWVSNLAFLGENDRVSVAVLLALDAMPPGPDHLEKLTLHCENAAGSSLAVALKDAGLADIEGICAQVSGEKDNYREEIQNIREAGKKAGEKVREAMALMRALRERSATAADLEMLERVSEEFPPGALLFFAASSHEESSYDAVVSPEHLLTFLEKQLAVEAPNPALTSLIPKAAEVLPWLTGEDPTGCRGVMRRAHSGDLEAMRAIALYYGSEETSLIAGYRLYSAWLQRPALAGDLWSMLRLSSYMLAQDEPAGAWAWAAIVADKQGTAGPDRNYARRLKTAIESGASAEIKARAVQHKKMIESALSKSRK